MPLVLLTLVVVGLILLAWRFWLNARAIRRDITRRYSDIQARLESNANDILDQIVKPDRS
jgi:hypothetical protein